MNFYPIIIIVSIVGLFAFIIATGAGEDWSKLSFGQKIFLVCFCGLFVWLGGLILLLGRPVLKVFCRFWEWLGNIQVGLGHSNNRDKNNVKFSRLVREELEQYKLEQYKQTKSI